MEDISDNIIKKDNVVLKNKNLVFSGGGYHGLIYLGLLTKLFENNEIDLEDVERIYGISVGSLVAVLIALSKIINWKDICDYFIERPWNKFFDLKKILSERMLSIFDSNKFFIINYNKWNEILVPLFKSADIDINITLFDFCKLTDIDIHLFSLHVKSMKMVEFNKILTPNITLTKALYYSCCIPGVFQQYYDNEYNSLMIDGGLLNNLPLFYLLINQTIQNSENTNIIKIMNTIKSRYIYNFNNDNIVEYNTILFDYHNEFKDIYDFIVREKETITVFNLNDNKEQNDTDVPNPLTLFTSLLWSYIYDKRDFYCDLMKKYLNIDYEDISNKYFISSSDMNIDDTMNILYLKETRNELFNYGYKYV